MPPAADRPHTLYRFFDAEGVLLYIGLTAYVGHRTATHRWRKPWWPDVARIDVEHYPDRLSAIEAERSAIESEHPRYNVHHGISRVPVEPVNGRVYSERHARRLRRGK